MANIGAFACVCAKESCVKCAELDMKWAADVVAERATRKPLRLTPDVMAEMRGLNWDDSAPGGRIKQTARVAC